MGFVSLLGWFFGEEGTMALRGSRRLTGVVVEGTAEDHGWLLV